MKWSRKSKTALETECKKYKILKEYQGDNYVYYLFQRYSEKGQYKYSIIDYADNAKTLMDKVTYIEETETIQKQKDIESGKGAILHIRKHILQSQP